MIQISYQDIYHNKANPQQPMIPKLLGCDRVLNIETIKDNFGYAITRIWIISDR